MKILYGKRFSNDLDDIRNLTNVKRRLLTVIQKFKEAGSIGCLLDAPTPRVVDNGKRLMPATADP